LVVIAIIGILVSLLLPAVQAAREAARRAQCQNNIKNVALALLHYHEAWTIFPAGSVWKEGTLQNVSESQLRESWIITTLPYMEQQGLYDSFDLTKFISDPLISDPNIIDNADARGTEIPLLLCPSDMYNRNKMDGSTGPESAGLGDGWARGNYACNAQEYFVYNNLRDKFSTDWNNLSYRGVMAANHSIGVA
jgi:type II secretory pathway pseudopilin PulG